MKRRSHYLLSCLIICVIAFTSLGVKDCDNPCNFIPADNLPEFMFGTSQGGRPAVPFAAELGVTWTRLKVSWDDVEPEIVNRDLTIADVDADPAMIIDYINDHDWSYSDEWLAELKDFGIKPLMIVGHGYTNTLPYYLGNRLSPDAIGRENYLGHIYLFTRAAVERYNGDGDNDAPGDVVVKHWQLENELNQAFFTALWGWRTPSFMDALGSAWQDWNFVTELLTTLHAAVKKEDPDALTTVNFHTDVPEQLDAVFGHPSWQNAIREWVPWIDFIGIDSYPNYYKSEPVQGYTLSQKVLEASARGCNKPVVIIETGYPAGPPERGFNEDLQAQYIQEAYDAAVNAGAQGFFLFGVKTKETHNVVLTQEDIDNIEYLDGLYQSGNIVQLIAWAYANEDYVFNHFVDALQSVEGYWGLFRGDGTKKPGWDVFRNLRN